MRTIVTDYLDELKIPYKIKPHTRPVFTSEDAAQERGVNLSQIVKTMLLKDEGGFTVVAVLPAHKKLDMKKIRKLTGHKDLQFMDRESIENRMGLTVGALAPISQVLKEIPMLVDPAVFEEEILDISSGDPNAGLEIHRDVLRKLLQGATLGEITKNT